MPSILLKIACYDQTGFRLPLVFGSCSSCVWFMFIWSFVLLLIGVSSGLIPKSGIPGSKG